MEKEDSLVSAHLLQLLGFTEDSFVICLLIWSRLVFGLRLGEVVIRGDSVVIILLLLAILNWFELLVELLWQLNDFLGLNSVQYPF